MFESFVLNVNLKQPIENDPGQVATRTQILEAAGEVFAETGFHDATVREICRRAQVNIAAINYHFGDKEKLYAEVLRYSQEKAVAKYPPLLDLGPGAPPEEKLRAFILSFLLRIYEKGSSAWYGKLMSQEMIHPTAALDILIAEKIRPMAEQLRGIVAEILRRPASDEAVRLCSFSIVSQCVFYHHCSPVLMRLYPEQPPLDTASAARLAEHITRFSLAALRHLPAPPSES
jgi:AcrR family transcriptional regulator